MLLNRYILILSFCLLASLNVSAQFVDYGVDPARFKWNMVKLDHYNLIYPRGLDSMAYRYAVYLENVYPHLDKTIGEPIRKKFPVILHPANVSSNGMVSWTPRRMELLTTPSAKQEAQRWDKHVVVHESRHVFQTSKVVRGWFKPLAFLMGEQSAGLANLFLPRWFLEGDAVSTETAMSNAGRGRLPEFNMTYRAQMLDGDKFFSFDKWALGSYKDYTGDYYALGYDITAYGRYRYGADLWDKVTSRYVVRYPFFSAALKHHTGVSVTGLHKETFAYLRDEWEQMDTGYVVPSYLSSPVKKRYTSYRYPMALNDSMVFAVKSGLSDINSLVFIANGKEERLCYLGNLNGRPVRSDNRIYWTEIVSGYRWTHENYSVLKYFDIETQKVRILTPRQRYLSPAVDESGDMIAVSRTTLEGEHHLVLLDAHTGGEYSYYKTPGNAFIKEMAFGEKGQIAAISINNKGIDILQLDIRTGKWSRLLPTTSANITAPVWQNGMLYFESGLNGTNNLYVLDPQTRKTYRLTSSRFGAFDPGFTKSGDRVFMSDYQVKGYRIASLPKDSLQKEEVNFKQPYRFTLAETLAEQEGFNLDSAKLKSVEFNPKPYRRFAHSVKVHSWAPFYYDVSDIMGGLGDDFSSIVKPGATIMSQNSLNTTIMQAGWYYDDGYHQGKLTYIYKGWLPVINFNINYGRKAYDMKWEKNDEDKDIIRGSYTGRNLLEAEAWVYIPFNFTRNHYVKGFQPSLYYFFTNNRYQQFESKKLRYFQYVLPELRFYNYRRMSQREILPRWGYQLRLQYLTPLFLDENYGDIYSAQLTTYWPGFIRDHSLMLRGVYQYQYLDNKALYIPERILPKTRGYDYLYATYQQAGFKADYAFPIFSPDVSIDGLIYISRIRANLFFDYTRNQANKKSGWSTQSSYGGDLLFDWNVLRIRYPLSTGVRFIQPIDYGKFQTEVLFSFSF